MKKYIYFAFAWIFNFEVEHFYLYRVKSTGLKVYKRDRRDSSAFETYLGTRYVLRQK